MYTVVPLWREDGTCCKLYNTCTACEYERARYRWDCFVTDSILIERYKQESYFDDMLEAWTVRYENEVHPFPSSPGVWTDEDF